MVMPAFDMESSSTSSSPDGTVAPPNSEDSATASPATREAGPAKATTGATAPTKPPPASLVSIPVKNRPAASSIKAGDLTRLFELARRQTVTPATPSEPSPSEPSPLAAATTEVAPAAEPVVSFLDASESLLPEIATEPPVEAVSPIEPPRISATTLAETPTEETSAEIDALERPLDIAPSEADVEANAVAAKGSVPASPHAVALAEQPEPASAPPKFATQAPNEETSAEIEALKRPLDVAPSEAEVEAKILDEPEAPRLTEPPHPVAPAARSEPIGPRISPAAKFTELADYWRSLRVGEDHPATEAVDHALVTERWPGSLLIAYTPAAQDPRGELRPGRVTRLGTACAETQNVVDAGSHATEWMLEAARTALINDEPVEEQQRLATLKGVAGFRMVALPLGPPKGLPNAILCALLPSPGAPRFGKRRTWL